MSLRLIEAIIPAASANRLHTILEGQDVLGVWIGEFTGDQAIARVLVPTRNTEAISDLIGDHFGLLPDFRLMLFVVEATLPRLEQDTEEDKQETADEDTNIEEQDQQEQDTQYPDRISRDELYYDISQSANMSPVYIATVVLSTLVAAVGILRSNVAVIIGAMVIAPLLGPNVALALASTLGDLHLAKRSIKTLIAGIATAFALSLVMGMVMAVDPQSPEIASRTQVGISDVVLALAAGSAGALAFTTGISATVIGVMVAVALLPPLVVIGLLAGGGYSGLALNALVLFITNVVCINLSGVVTFLAQKIRPRTWWATETAGQASRTALIIWVVTLALLIGIMILIGPAT
jgi:uncharacterized hydrophobic protein (TIGR00341 family)